MTAYSLVMTAYSSIMTVYSSIMTAYSSDYHKLKFAISYIFET